MARAVRLGGRDSDRGTGSRRRAGAAEPGSMTDKEPSKAFSTEICWSLDKHKIYPAQPDTTRLLAYQAHHSAHSTRCLPSAPSTITQVSS